jgi:RimJ/RimL family protein N-acetyltransferase
MAPWPEAGVRAGGVLLRTWRPEDVVGRLALDSDPEVFRWSPLARVPDLAWVTERIEQAVQDAAAGCPTSFAVVAADEPARVLGSVDWRNRYPTPPFSLVDIGYGVAPAARGRGVGSTAVRLLTEWLMSPDGGDVHRVQLDHAVGNVASCRTALRVGFAIEGRRPGYLPLRETESAPVVRHTVCLHGRVRPDRAGTGSTATG